MGLPEFCGQALLYHLRLLGDGSVAHRPRKALDNNASQRVHSGEYARSQGKRRFGRKERTNHFFLFDCGDSTVTLREARGHEQQLRRLFFRAAQERVFVIIRDEERGVAVS